ncbi:HD-like signal output (HDOD) domain, no enzymatic activity [Methylomagnum ishizawai]|uniref:HD-like signal output (HDOD) domain, no enzymatic activity n=1 Tax=Methylomagnum ishizawai TaxID=1760988 RepID=A0A1Y6CTQ2_9GAMM|nr:HDOD domain-containing protein [Methylomagnum ishizawai]SMF93667.1 HD-like signal output (HDOD) domain, no enzymatic activity [Methylomagnum ishizawai]
MGFLRRLFGVKHREPDSEISELVEASPERRVILPSARLPLPITLDILKQLFPIRNLDDDELGAYALERKAEVCGPGSILFRAGYPIKYVHYLLEGTVVMDVGPGTRYEIGADTAKARFPLCYGKHYTATAEAKTDVQILRVSAKIMSLGSTLTQEVPHSLDADNLDIPEAVRESSLFQAFSQHYRDDELRVPSLPEVAARVGQAVREDIGLAEIARIVQLDPVIAARLVHIANSPLYLPSRPAVTCLDAVSRLGLLATRNLVMAFSLKQVFRCKDEDLARIAQNHWRRSIHLSALCYVLAADNPGMSQEEALLAGLLADIGAVPCLYFTENLPRTLWTPAEVEAILPLVRGPVGAYLLKRWDFPPELGIIPQVAEDWYYDGGERLTLNDIVILSKLHAYIGTPQMAALPAINAIPACAKLKNHQLSPAYSLRVLHEAKDAIAQAMKFFEG